MRLYFTLYHEATLANLLKIAMFHGHICEQGGDLLIELADYCARKMTLLISGCVCRFLLACSRLFRTECLIPLGHKSIVLDVVMGGGRWKRLARAKEQALVVSRLCRLVAAATSLWSSWCPKLFATPCACCVLRSLHAGNQTLIIPDEPPANLVHLSVGARARSPRT